MNKAALPLLLLLVLLGNGLRSVVSSTVFVSEGTFASFLKISVNKTSVIIELLLGAVLLSLLITPRLIQRFPARPLAAAMCLIAGVSSLGLAVLFWVAPPVATREALVVVLFPLIGFSLAALAPIAQMMTVWGGERHSKLLTGVWAVAMPAAFLVTPQLVRVIAPRYGLDIFFAGFAMVPFLLMLGLWMVREPVKETAGEAGEEKAASFALLPVLAVLITFEAVTTLVSLSGISAPETQIAAGFFAASLAYLIVRARRGRGAEQAPRAPVEGATLGVFAFLFFVNVATTGFYDTAYLVKHMCSNTLIADRATIGALAQVVAAMGATAILARMPIQRALMLAGAVITAAGLGSYMLYFGFPYYEVYLGSKALTGFGTGLLTTAAVFAVTGAAGKNAHLSLFIAFVIIVGTEVGLELFEILIQVMEMLSFAPDAVYSSVFVLQAVLVVVAMPFLFAKEASPGAIAAEGAKSPTAQQ